MLVHSFGDSHPWFDDFAAFSVAMGLPMANPGVCSASKLCEGVNLRLAWLLNCRYAVATIELVTLSRTSTDGQAPSARVLRGNVSYRGVEPMGRHR